MPRHDRVDHAAAVVDIGQRQVLDFSSWMPSNSFLGALITGMFGIPSDPRLIEVLGWLLYAIPVLVVFLWPAKVAATPAARRKLLAGTAAALAAGALALTLLVPAEGAAPPGPTRTAARADGSSVTVTFAATGGSPHVVVVAAGRESAIPLQPAGSQSVDGVEAQVWQAQVTTDPALSSATATLKQLAELTGGRLPVGLDTVRTPGPFAATWSATRSYSVVAHDDSLISAQSESNRVAVLGGGGIKTTKTVSLGGLGDDWATTPADAAAVATRIARTAHDHAERALWRIWLPTLLAAAAASSAVAAMRTGQHSPTSSPPSKERHDDNDEDRHHEPAPSDEVGAA